MSRLEYANAYGRSLTPVDLPTSNMLVNVPSGSARDITFPKLNVRLPLANRPKAAGPLAASFGVRFAPIPAIPVGVDVARKRTSLGL
jgi:hypothetical protein